MRERLAQRASFLVVLGITPAYAGKTGAKGELPCRPWDHPRVCGKDSAFLFGFYLTQGSPPRMRERPVIP